MLALNQHAKVLELSTDYDVCGSNGERVAGVRQFGQSRGKRAARFLTAFDQFFTHHFEVLGRDDEVLLRTTRPRKWFRTTVFKSWEGWAHTAMTRADRYTVRIHRPLEVPLRRLTIAAALAVDLALKQDARGLG